MRGLFALSAVVVLLAGGSVTYALVGRHTSQKVAISNSTIEAPQVETARLFSTPISTPEPDLIAAKLTSQTIWPAVPMPKAKATPKTATSLPATARPNAKQLANTVGHVIDPRPAR